MKIIKSFIIACWLMTMPAILQISVAGEVGTWTIYPAQGNISWLEKVGSKVFVLDNSNLWLVDASTGEVRQFDKTNVLSDNEIDRIAWCSQAKRLIILYSNHNIDLMDIDGNVTNISDYYSKSTTLDKTVNGLNINGRYAYLSTNFGVVQIDVVDAVIKNTFNLGIAVQWTHFDDSYIYAETISKGVLKCLLTENMLDKNNWIVAGSYTPETRSIDQDALELIKNIYIADGPRYPLFDYTCFQNNILYSVPGRKDTNTRKGYLQKYNGTKWTNVGDNVSYISTRAYRNLIFVTPFPGQPNKYYIGGETGLYEMVDTTIVKEWWFGNSTLQYPQSLDETYIDWCLVTSGVFDSNKNFWCFSGEGAKPGINKLDTNGKWTFYPHEEMRATEYVGFVVPTSAFFDSRGILWFTNNDWRTPALARYDINTDKMVAFTKFVNEDGTSVEVSYPSCCAEDKEGNIWIGSWAGTLYLAAEDIGSTNPTFMQVKVPRNDGSGLADYLLANIHISCMAIDGGNRKWFGTETNGVYVISSDNITEVHHFTTDNSPLLSNSISHIAIDGEKGEVYISTSKGLCSYKDEATTPQEEINSSNIYAYPNPVEPSFTGMITVNGLTYNCHIKIVNASGNVVNEGRSTGGSYQWNGCDMNGSKVASGVYTVLAIDPDGKGSGGCKIAIVR